MKRVTQISKYRQSGWKRKDNGVIEVFYGADVPEKPEDFDKVWDNIHIQTLIKEPYVHEDGTHIALNDLGSPEPVV